MVLWAVALSQLSQAEWTKAGGAWGRGVVEGGTLARCVRAPWGRGRLGRDLATSRLVRADDRDGWRCGRLPLHTTMVATFNYTPIYTRHMSPNGRLSQICGSWKSYTPNIRRLRPYHKPNGHNTYYLIHSYLIINTLRAFYVIFCSITSYYVAWRAAVRVMTLCCTSDVVPWWLCVSARVVWLSHAGLWPCLMEYCRVVSDTSVTTLTVYPFSTVSEHGPCLLHQPNHLCLLNAAQLIWCVHSA